MPIVPYPPRNRRGIPPSADGLSPAWDRQPFKYNDGTDIYQASEGAAIYVGIELTKLTVVQKGAADPNDGNDTGVPTNVTIYYGVPAGSFMPIDILTVTEAVAADAVTYPDPAPYVLALF
jgi:hypothetical protein